jgi:hypothetical protein
MKATSLVITLCLCVFVLCAQHATDEGPDAQRFSDDLLGYPDTDSQTEDDYENLLQTLSSPYDLNKVSAEELKSLHLLTDSQVENFITYRKQQGPLLDLYELQAIPGFDLPLISRLLPFVKVSDPAAQINHRLLQRIFSKDHSYVVARHERTLETRRGFKATDAGPAAYKGSPDKLYFRMRSSQSGDYSIGITGEKDAGEIMSFNRRTRQWGFDFTSYHLQLQNKGKISNLIIGDFQTQFAQGLILGGAFGLGKGGESVSTVRKANLGFLPYTSINETAYQRGAAITLLPFGAIEISAFFSRALRDASLCGAGDSLTLTTFQKTGYHRSAAEVAFRKTVREQHGGLVLRVNQNKLDAGLIVSAVHFDAHVEKNATPYNQFDFKGTSNLNAGFFFNYRMGNISFFSEVAQSVSGGSGLVAGVLMSLHPDLDVAMVCRNYMRDFYTFYSNAFSESTEPKNEKGIYWGWKYKWNRKYNLSGYMDLFRFPWLAFRRYTPSSGTEWLLRGTYQPGKTISVFIQAREEIKPRNLPSGANLYTLDEGRKRNLTLNFDYGLNEKIRLKTRGQYNSYSFNEPTSQGFALVQDLSVSAGPFRFTGRHAIFHTDEYDNRHYIYENDAWLSYSLPAYAGTGVRNFALFEYKVGKGLTIWVRYARTRVINAAETGSGQEAIAGNTKNDVKFQARYRF